MNLRTKLVTLLLPLVGFVGSAYAAVPKAVTDALATAKTDLGTIGGAVLALVLVIVTFQWMRRILR